MEIIEIIFEVLILILGLYLAFFKSYFQKKGENFATKEDIGDITKIVEEIKSSFSTDIELFKSNLQLLTNLQIGIASKELNAIIDYNVKYSNWLNTLIDTSIKNINSYDDLELDKYNALLSDHYANLSISQTMLSLFVTDKLIIEKANGLVISTLKLMPKPLTNYIYKLRLNNLNRIKHKNDNEKTLELITERTEVHKVFCNETVEAYKELRPIYNDFIEISRGRIYGLIENK